MNEKKIAILTGLIGLLAAVLVGAGEFLLHFDPQARFADGDYTFMLAASDSRQTIGHFLGTLAAPLYIVGCWHIYLMLKPANQKLAFIAFLIGAYGFIIGGDWISSRASIGAITHLQDSASLLKPLVDLYELRYENLLTVIRITTLLLSIIVIYLAWGGKSYYHKAMAFFNPIVLLLLNFVIYIVAPDVGKYLMPIALNVGFGLFFVLSLLHTSRIPKSKEVQ